MLKDKLHGRGTTYCPKCQNVCISIGITGKIASGKSTLLTYIKEKGYKIFSCDDEVKNLYKQDKIITRLKDIFGNDVITKAGNVSYGYIKNIISLSDDTKKELEVGRKPNLLNRFPNIAVRSLPCNTGLGSFVSLAQLAVR